MEPVREKKTAETNHFEGVRAFFLKDPIHASSLLMLLKNTSDGCAWAQFEVGNEDKTFISGTYKNESIEDVIKRLTRKYPGGSREAFSFMDHTSALTQEQIKGFLRGQKIAPEQEFEEVMLPKRPLTEKPRKY